MKPYQWISAAISLFCMALVPWAQAQERTEAQQNFPLLMSESDVDSVTTKLRGRSDFSNIGREWVAELEQAGIVNRSLRGPYRVAVPLMSFGRTGPKLMITYARKLPGASGEGVLLFIHIPTQ